MHEDACKLENENVCKLGTSNVQSILYEVELKKDVSKAQVVGYAQ